MRFTNRYILRMDLKTYIEIRETQGERGIGKIIAGAVGVSQVIISQWKTGARIVPAERCIDIDRATHGAVTCEDLRPDLIDRWAYLRGTERKAA